MNTNQQTALVTGANSGIGLETVKQLSLLGFKKIILACRTKEKGDLAIKNILKEGFSNIYSVIALDLTEKNSSHDALQELIHKKQKIDILILNACVNHKTLKTNSDGMELTFASALLGHHILTNGLLKANLLSINAKIVTAGSEAARGDVPMMKLPNIDAETRDTYSGNYEIMLKSFIFPNKGKRYKPMETYALTKLLVSLWTEALARRLPIYIITNSISPGATPDTNFARHQSWVLQKVMMPLMKKVGPYIEMSGNIENAAKRYLKILTFDNTTNGKFWASKKGKMSGPISIFSSSYIENTYLQEIVWKILEESSNIQHTN